MSFGLAGAIWRDDPAAHQIARADADPAHTNLSDQAAHAGVGTTAANHDDSSHLLHVAAGDLEVTEAQQAAADTLVAETRASSEQFARVESARAAGYAELGADTAGEDDLVYLFNQAFIREGTELNPERPEALAYLRTPSGLRLVGALYLAPAGGGPRVGGGLTIWDRYSVLCLDQSFTVMAALGGQTGCPNGTNPLASPPDALHVWTFDHPNGPFAPRLTESARQVALRQVTG